MAIVDRGNGRKLNSVPTHASDGDEYPKLIIEDVTTLNFDCKLMYVGEGLKDILILKDVATWQNNSSNWLVEADIGIKLVF
ncbi:hypothetical protein PaecuDRAFT_4373 [Paenibacillus curdlanolyticus YK9]|uniref:Uncharacterized protein n=1 Tax=Paenibacillus curdlanolyticus YK9 TaxID=717606 RepID=E0IFD2_9BACL|nr:hypothetical protein [Paenibacillus curdlanolyticus]EFM08908.1 hypothetical protein PaecuDRAFT_4373 [Paenibacillus curdlanolyticus YK9]